MLEISQELVKLLAKGESAALATIISSHGSAPRKAGAKMLIRGDESFIGTVGGGGVELQVSHKAMEIMNTGDPQMVHFDLAGKDCVAQMICGGQVDIFLETRLRDNKTALEIHREIVNLASKGESAVLATVISSRGAVSGKPGAKMLIRRDQSVLGSVGGDGIEPQVLEQAPQILRHAESKLVHFEVTDKERAGQMDVFMEPVIPPATLYLCGAGHISHSTAAFGKMLGFKVTVIDPRPEFNNPERFPDADNRIIDDYALSLSKLNIGEEGYIIICTPGHILDEQCLYFAVGTKAKYIGMIGSRKKVKETKEQLIKKGIKPEQLENVHAPIGLEIGAETPAEIAISILAEIIKVRRATGN